MAKPILSVKADIIDEDDEMKRILKEIEDPEFDSVDIGILADEEEQLRIIASANEFGTRDGHIESRSFIRSAMDDNEALINREADRVYGQIIDGNISMQDGLGEMGERIQALITRKITTLRHPKNAESTIARKKSSNPLIDTGRMRASIRWTLAKQKDGESGI